MLNAWEIDTVITINRHNDTSKIVAILRRFVNNNRNKAESCAMEYGGNYPMVVVPSCEMFLLYRGCLEPGYQILEFKAAKSYSELIEDLQNG